MTDTPEIEKLLQRIAEVQARLDAAKADLIVQLPNVGMKADPGVRAKLQDTLPRYIQCAENALYDARYWIDRAKADPDQAQTVLEKSDRSIDSAVGDLDTLAKSLAKVLRIYGPGNPS